MYRIDSATAAGVLPAIGAVGPNPNGFWTNGNPGAGVPATVLDQDWHNTVQEELINVLAAAGVAPVKGTNNQLATAIVDLITAAVTAGLTGAGLQPGAVFFHLGNTAPAGALELNGASLLRTTYANLFGLFGASFGAADGAHFNLPDVRGYFLRAFDNGRGVDPGRALWSFIADKLQGHLHSLGAGYREAGSGFGFSGASGVDSTVVTQTQGLISDGVNGAPRVGTETAPKSFALLICVKY